MKYDVCTLEDFQTLSALPDLLKHEPQFLKYFGLHFFNNDIDSPPMRCKIDYKEALDPNSKPNILRAMKKLLKEFECDNELSFIEFSYFIHLLAELHQPFHCNIVGLMIYIFV